jgi:hypothetical protein
MPERLDDITVEELSLVPKGAHPGTDFVPLSKSADNENVEEEITENLEKSQDDSEANADQVADLLKEGAITPNEAREELDKQDSVDLAKSFIDGIDGLTNEQLTAVADAILAKTADEDMPEEDEEDPLNDRMDRMEKAIAAVTDELAKSHSEILERLEKSSEKQAPEQVAPESEVDPALAKGVDSLLEKLAKLEGQFRNVEARAKAALGEDPGEI